jgi:hypothetical protein
MISDNVRGSQSYHRYQQLQKISAYLSKHQLLPSQIKAIPSPKLGIVVVIPCYDEPDLVPVLHALERCQRPTSEVEVIVVINASQDDVPAVHQRNRMTLTNAQCWLTAHSANPGVTFHLLHLPALPSRHAGVGLARKIGMDEAIARFFRIGNPGGIIVSLDADCVCDADYLQAIAEHFEAHPKTPGCSIYFEHAAPAGAGPAAQAAMLNYELFLRYYLHGLRLSGFPYAFYTVGSCMAVRSWAYAQQGGMNRRRGGEDIYFFHKIIPLGGFTELCATRVVPSARRSTRTPFGTGRSINAQLSKVESDNRTYAPAVFRDLQALFSRLDCLFRGVPDGYYDDLPASITRFLRASHFADHLIGMRQNAASTRTFAKRFFQWFNGLRILQYVRFATKSSYPHIPLVDAAVILLRWQGLAHLLQMDRHDTESVLHCYRWLDRQQLEPALLPSAATPDPGKRGLT